VLEYRDVEHDINVRLPLFGPGFNVADVVLLSLMEAVICLSMRSGRRKKRELH